MKLNGNIFKLIIRIYITFIFIIIFFNNKSLYLKILIFLFHLNIFLFIHIKLITMICDNIKLVIIIFFISMRIIIEMIWFRRILRREYDNYKTIFSEIFRSIIIILFIFSYIFILIFLIMELFFNEIILMNFNMMKNVDKSYKWILLWLLS